MDTDNLVRMANRIGEFFQAMPDHEEAMDGIASHLRRYWEPRMRRLLLQHVEQGGTVGLLPIVAQTLATRRERLLPD
jgi:formate dehydrogenase subunit delta